MKKITTLILLCWLSILSSTAQQELIDGQWVLDYMVIDNNTYVVPPLYSPTPACLPINYFPGIDFSEDTSGEYQAIAILTFNNWFHDSSNQSMTIDANSFTTLGAVTLGECDCICDLENYYLGTILAGDFNTRTFTYTITESGDTRILTITTPEDDIAVFYDFVLSLEEQQEKLPLIVYPNPSSKYLHIEIEDPTVQSLEVISLFGQKMASFSNTIPRTIDISKLSNGLYFVEIHTANGRKSVTRFIKT